MFGIIYFKLLLLFLSFIGKSLTDQANIGFTIDTEGKRVITTQISGQTEFSAIAFTEIGTLIKYKSDTSIVSTKKFEVDDTNAYTKSFICQYATNKVVLTRDKKIFEITFNSNGEDSLTFKEEANQIITNLHCNNNKYIYTYLSSDSTSYNFKVSGSSLITSSSQALLSHFESGILAGFGKKITFQGQLANLLKESLLLTFNLLQLTLVVHWLLECLGCILQEFILPLRYFRRRYVKPFGQSSQSLFLFNRLQCDFCFELRRVFASSTHSS